MPDLAPLSAFARPEARRLRRGPVLLAENTSLGLASVALPRGAPVPTISGLVLPGPGGWVEGAGIAAFWTGPGQWMVEADGRAEGNLDRELRDAVPEAAVTEQSYGWVVLELQSEAGAWPVERVMEKTVNLDPAWLKPGRATRTGLEHMSVFVIRRSAARLAVLGMRSTAGSLWHALEAAITHAS